MSPELTNIQRNAEQKVLTSIVEQISCNRDLFCAGIPIETNQSAEKMEHMHIVVAPKEPIFDPLVLNTFARSLIIAEKEQGVANSNFLRDYMDGGMMFTSLNFPEPIGIAEVSTNIKTTVTAIDRKALKRRGVNVGDTHSCRTEKKRLENLITVHVLPDILSAKIAYAYLSDAVEEQPYGSIVSNLDVRHGGNYITGKQLRFLKENQGMDVLEAVKATEALVDDEE